MRRLGQRQQPRGHLRPRHHRRQHRHPGGHLLPQLREGQVHPRRGLLGGLLGGPSGSEEGVEAGPGEYCIYW